MTLLTASLSPPASNVTISTAKEHLLTFCRSQARVKIGNNSAGVRGTLATHALKQGEVIILVPANLTITLLTVADHSIQASSPLRSL